MRVIGVLGNMGTYQRTPGRTGNKGTISLLSGNRKHCKRLRKIKFLLRKATLHVDFCKICQLVQQNPSVLSIYDISSMSQTTACLLSRFNELKVEKLCFYKSVSQFLYGTIFQGTFQNFAREHEIER